MRSISRGLLLALALTFVATAAHATKYGTMAQGANRRFEVQNLAAKMSASESSHTVAKATLASGKLTNAKPAPKKAGVLKSLFHIQ